MMKQAALFPSALVAGVLLFALPASSAGVNGINNSMPNRISMNRCMDPSGKPVTDPAACASGGCVDDTGRKVTDPSTCASPPSSAPASPAPEQDTIIKSKSNVKNN
jgi:hypothetical protein